MLDDGRIIVYLVAPMQNTGAFIHMPRGLEYKCGRRPPWRTQECTHLLQPPETRQNRINWPNAFVCFIMREAAIDGFGAKASVF